MFLNDEDVVMFCYLCALFMFSPALGETIARAKKNRQTIDKRKHFFFLYNIFLIAKVLLVCFVRQFNKKKLTFFLLPCYAFQKKGKFMNIRKILLKNWFICLRIFPSQVLFSLNVTIRFLWSKGAQGRTLSLYLWLLLFTKIYQKGRL